MFGINRKKKFKYKKALERYAISDQDGADELRKMSALIRFHFKIDPDTLSDNAFAKLWGDLRFCLDFENKRNALEMP